MTDRYTPSTRELLNQENVRLSNELRRARIERDRALKTLAEVEELIEKGQTPAILMVIHSRISQAFEFINNLRKSGE
jgi:fido (protein-threonine AMPylation protein)